MNSVTASDISLSEVTGWPKERVQAISFLAGGASSKGIHDMPYSLRTVRSKTTDQCLLAVAGSNAARSLTVWMPPSFNCADIFRPPPQTSLTGVASNIDCNFDFESWARLHTCAKSLG